MKDEILQPIPQETPEEQILEGILQKTVEGVEQDGAIGEAQLLMQKEVADATKETNTLLDMALPHLTKEVQKVEIVPTVAPTDDQTELAKTFYEMLRGRKGEAGYTPQKGTDYFTDEEVREFLAKTTPKKGTDYFTDEEVATFRELVTPVKGVDYRDGIDGVDGKDGRTPVLGVDYFVPTEEELLAKVPTIDAVLAKIPKPKDGKDGKVPDLDPFLKEMEERLQKDLADRTEVLRKISSRDYDLSELKDVLLTNLQNGQALLYNSLTQKWYNGTVSGGGGGTWGSITGTLSDQTDLQDALDAKLASSLTKAQFDTACSDGNFLFVGDITQYTDEMAQDAVGSMVNDSLVYDDATPSLGLNLNKANVFTADQSVPDEAYGSGWNGSMEVPTKNAVYDQMETKAPLTSPALVTPTLSAPVNTYTVEPSSDDVAYGDVIAGILGGATIAQWELVYLDASSGRWEIADADAVGTAGSVLIGLAMTAGTDGNALSVLVRGIVRNDAWTWTTGNALYASTTAGAMTATAPSGTDDVVRVLGYATSDDSVWFDPAKAWLTHV